MNSTLQKILAVLGVAETVTGALSHTPIASFGKAGEVLGIAFVAEETLSAILTSVTAANSAAPAPAAPFAGPHLG